MLALTCVVTFQMKKKKRMKDFCFGNNVRKDHSKKSDNVFGSPYARYDEQEFPLS